MKTEKKFRTTEAEATLEQTAILRDRLIGCVLSPLDREFYLNRIDRAIENLQTARLHVDTKHWSGSRYE